MPIDYSNYPDNWDEVRRDVLLRAGGGEADPRVGARCEWCGVVNYAIGHRYDGVFYPADYAVDYGYAVPPSYALARAEADHRNAHYREGGYSVIVLTIAHVHDPDPMNCDLDNLAALCQGCHNQHDAAMRAVNAAETRRQRVIEAGQMELWSE